MGTYNTYSGRCGDIIDSIMVRANDTEGENTPPADWLILVNGVLAQLALHGVWVKSDTTDLTAGTAEVDLLTAFTDFVELVGVNLTSSHWALDRLLTLDEYQRAQQSRCLYVFPPEESGNPTMYLYGSGRIFLWPTPSATVTDGLTVTYKYAPAPMDGGSTEGSVTEPEGLPQANDAVLVFGALAERALRDINARNADKLYAAWNTRYRQELGKLLRPLMPTQLRPYR
jgi:hypothetical protein